MNEVTIKGLDELQKVLEDLPKKVANKVLRDDLQGAADYLSQEMAASAPYRTGFLSEHFGSRVSIHSGEVAGSAYVGPGGKMYYPQEGAGEFGGKTEGDEWRRVATGKHPVKGGLVPVASVARFLEFGTSRMPPKPFMTQAFDSSKDALLVKIVEGIKSALSGWLK
jgi:HK97 gp10 family phage protein